MPSDPTPATPPSTTLTVCVTCGFRAEDPDAVRPGALFADLVERALESQRPASEPAMRLRRTTCLMSCHRPCSAALQAPDKYTYVFADLDPDAASVEALLGYAHAYRASRTGVVPYKLWPDGIEGRFAARVPPAPDLD